MTDTIEATCSLVFERVLRHPPAKVWKALTRSWLIAEWLMPNDFRAEIGHHFTLRAAPLPGWSGTTRCEVVAVDEPRLLAYRWGDGTESASGVKTVVTWTLTPQADGGTLLRLEQSGFRPQDHVAHQRIGAVWPGLLARLEQAAGGAA